MNFFFESLMAGGGMPPEEFGDILNDSFARASLGASYQVNGTATFSPNGSLLQVSGGGATTDRLRYLYPNSFEYWEQSISYTLTATPSSTTSGIGLGKYDLNTPDGQRTVYCRLITNNNSGNFGRVAINSFDGTTNTQQAVSTGTAVAVTNGSNFLLTFSRSKTTTNVVYTATILNVGTGGTNTVSWSFVPSNTLIADCTGDFALFALGTAGTYNVTNWNVSSSDLKNIEGLFIGDSITYTYASTNLTTRWASLVGDTLSSYQVSAGPGDVTQRVLDKIQNILDYNPQKVFLMIGGNDILFGVSSGTWQANYTSIVTQLNNAGIQVIHCLATPRDATDVTPLNTWISSTFSSHLVIDTFTPLKGSGTDLAAAYDSDGVHPNQAGHTLISTTVINAL